MIMNSWIIDDLFLNFTSIYTFTRTQSKSSANYDINKKNSNKAYETEHTTHK